MRVLLDTHALLWWLSGDAKLSDVARSTISDDRNDVFVSAASAWEVATKHRIGKLPKVGALAVDFAHEIRAQGFAPLAITIEHAQTAGALVTDHRDPFDRMLIAQAREERLALVSIESIFDQFDITRIW